MRSPKPSGALQLFCRGATTACRASTAPRPSLAFLARLARAFRWRRNRSIPRTCGRRGPLALALRAHPGACGSVSLGRRTIWIGWIILCDCNAAKQNKRGAQHQNCPHRRILRIVYLGEHRPCVEATGCRSISSGFAVFSRSLGGAEPCSRTKHAKS